MEQKKLYVKPNVEIYKMAVNQFLCESGDEETLARPLDFTETEDL